LSREKLGQQIVFDKWSPSVQVPDHIPTTPASSDSIQIPPTDSLRVNSPVGPKLDSLIELYQALSRAIATSSEELQRSQDVQNAYHRLQNPSGKLFDQQRIKQFKLGNSAPTFSPLVLDGTRIQGVIFTTESKKLHVDLAGGWIARQQPGMLAPADQNPLSNWRRNMLNRNGKIFYARVGYGTQSGSHIYLSGFHGMDELDNGFANGFSKRRTSNLELEGQWTRKSHSLNLRAAQRVNQPSASDPEFSGSRNTDPRDISAFSASHTSAWDKAAVKIDVNAQWIGPQYYSIGSPFLRGDNASVGARISTKKLRWFQPGVIGNYSYNDVRNLSPFGSNVRYAGFEVTSQPFTKLILSGSWAPTLVAITSQEGSQNMKNSVYSATAMFNHAWKKVNWTMMGNLSRMIQLWDSLVIENTSYTAASTLLFHQQFTWEVSYNYSSLKGLNDVDFNLTSLNTTFGLNTKKGMIVMAGCSVVQDNSSSAFGFLGSLQLPLFQNCHGLISYEQFPVFDSTELFYTSALSMPFLAQIRLTYHLTKK